MTKISQETLSCYSLISELYAGVTDDPPWLGFVSSLRQHCNADLCSLVVYRGAEDEKPYIVIDNPSSTRVEVSPLSYVLRDKLVARRLTVSSLHGATHKDGELSVHLVANGDIPFERVDVGFEVQGGDSWHCAVCVAREPGSTAFKSAERDAIHLISEDLAKAARMFSELDRSRTQGIVLQRAMDKLGIGTIFLNKRRRIVDINHEALRVLEKVESVTIREGSIYFRDLCRRKDFEDGIESALACDRSDGGLGLISLNNDDGEKLDILILPIVSEGPWTSDTGPAIVVYMQSLSIRKSIPVSLIAEIFGLSYVEAHLAVLVSQGYTLESAAEALGIKVSTARSYSKNIYLKLGISRQVDLVRKILRSVALLA